MKKNLLLPLLLALVMLAGVSTSYGQCTPDPQYNTPGIYPSDTLPDLQVGVAYSHVVDFVFPNDTVLGGFTQDFDSFTVNSISNIPPGLQWECNNNHPVCVYVVVQPQFAKGCVTIFGTPTSPSAAYPGYDSTIVNGTAWFTFFGAQSIQVDIPVYYRTAPPVAIDDRDMDEIVGLEVKPNPITSNSVVAYNLPYSGEVSISLYNVAGQKVNTIHNGMQNAGRHVLPVSLNTQLAKGTYFVRFEMDGGKYSATQKLVSFN